MSVKGRELTRSRAIFILIACAALLALIVLLCSEPEGGGLDSTEKRAAYLASLGWEVDASSEEHRAVLIPEELDSVLRQYNALQKQQGFDLERYCGRELDCWCYELASYPSGEENVTAVLYTCKGRAVAGDIHSNALGGFMHGIK